MSTQPKTYLTPEEYLEIERKAEFRSEYYRGEMFAMSGALIEHVLITTNLIGELRDQVRKRSCQIYGADMRVKVGTSGLYTYPDVSATCGKPQLIDGQFDTLLNPRLIVEVLSATTEAYDRGRKFEHYRTIESLQEYMLVASDRVHIELFRRQADGQWVLSDANKPEQVIELASIECRLLLSDVYEKVEFPEATR